MTNWTFDASQESWTPGGVWNASLLCLNNTSTGGQPSYQSPSVSVPVVLNDPFSCHVRVTATGTGTGGSLAVRLRASGGGGNYDETINITLPDDPSGYDSGWQTISDVFPGTDTIDGVQVDFNISLSIDPGYPFETFVDNVYLAEADPASVPPPDRRYLGIDADFGHVYLTSITGGTLIYNSLMLGGTAYDGTATFGTAAYTDPDTFSRGLYPVVRPGADGILYLRGRDATNRQLLFNDLNGTAGFVDIGPGTATWVTTKFCVALLPSVVEPEDVVAAFSDDDVYRTEGPMGTAGALTWTKQGDAPGGLRVGARHPTQPENIYLAGTAAGEFYPSVNMGVSHSSVGGTAVAGTINAVEVSR
jgi:hypothetical protein